MAPPGRTATKLFNFAAIDSWRGCAQRLHGGDIKFKQGFAETRQYRTFEHTSWDHSDFRCLHMAFVRRSSLQTQQDAARPNVSESWAGGWRARIRRAAGLVCRTPPASTYKQESYRRGDRTTVGTRAFFTPDGGATPPSGGLNQ
jgi:hypothetical protein